MTKLQERVKEIVESQGTKEEQQAYVQDVLQHGCVSGMVSELIYTHHCQEWYDEYYEDIEELRINMEEDIGEPLVIGDRDLKNTYAWFSFEETVRLLYDI